MQGFNSSVERASKKRGSLGAAAAATVVTLVATILGIKWHEKVDSNRFNANSLTEFGDQQLAWYRHHFQMSRPMPMAISSNMLLIPSRNDATMIVYSAVKLTPKLKELIDERMSRLGLSKFIIILPSKEHYLFAAEWLQAYGADHISLVLCVPGTRDSLMKNVGDTSVFDKIKEASAVDSTGRVQLPQELSASEFQAVLVGGIPSLNELVIFHVPSKTAIFGDLMFNFDRRDIVHVNSEKYGFSPLINFYASRVARMFQRGPTVPPRRFFRFKIEDDDAFRKSVDVISSWPWTSAFMTHGTPISAASTAEDNKYELRDQWRSEVEERLLSSKVRSKL